MKQKLLGPILIFLFILFLSLAIIFYARGYRLDFKKRTLRTTGLLAATSFPSGASIFVNGRLTSATNDTLNLEPGWYNIKLTKEGYIPWEKKIKIKKEMVSLINATLFPSTPSLTPLTSTGAKSPCLSPDGLKIAYIVPNKGEGEGGVFVLDLNTHPFSFSKKPRIIFSHKISDEDKVSLLWSPDSNFILFKSETCAFLLEANKKNDSPTNVIGTLPSLISSWEKEKEELEKRKLLSLPEDLVEVFTSSAKILSFSIDESKILFQATASAKISKVIKPPLLVTNPTEETREITPKKIYVYDRKEDRNYEIEVEKSLLPQWLPTSRHLILTEKNKISILEYDGTNKATVYAGPFEENFVAPSPDGTKLIILTSLNPATQTLPNLYALSLK